MYGRYIEADSVTEAGRRILFYAGDHEDSKTLFRAVVERFGYAPVDLGSLQMGRLMQVDGDPNWFARHTRHQPGMSTKDSPESG